MAGLEHSVGTGTGRRRKRIHDNGAGTTGLIAAESGA